MVDRNRIESALKKSYELERELDAQFAEFTRLIWEIVEQPDAKRKLDFIETLLSDPAALDRAAELMARK